MANITISQLRPAGYDLFHDSETFLNELINQEILTLERGGFFGGFGFGHSGSSGFSGHSNGFGFSNSFGGFGNGFGYAKGYSKGAPFYLY